MISNQKRLQIICVCLCYAETQFLDFMSQCFVTKIFFINVLLLRNYIIKRNITDEDKTSPKYQCLVTEFQGKIFTDGNKTVPVRREMIAEFWWGNMKEIHRLEDLDGDGRITPKWIVNGMEWRALDSTGSG